MNPSALWMGWSQRSAPSVWSFPSLCRKERSQVRAAVTSWCWDHLRFYNSLKHLLKVKQQAWWWLFVCFVLEVRCGCRPVELPVLTSLTTRTAPSRWNTPRQSEACTRWTSSMTATIFQVTPGCCDHTCSWDALSPWKHSTFCSFRHKETSLHGSFSFFI